MVDKQYDYDNGYRSGVFVGEPPFFQGEQWADRPQNHLTYGQFDGHYCGTADQWDGNLTSTNRADLHAPACCRFAAGIFKPLCECAQASFLAGEVADYQLKGCQCVVSSVAEYPSGVYSVNGCQCLAFSTAWKPLADYQLTACGCLSASVTSAAVPRYQFTACACTSASLTAHVTGFYSPLACMCLQGSLAERPTGVYSPLACECLACTCIQKPTGYYSCTACECLVASVAQKPVGDYSLTSCECLKASVAVQFVYQLSGCQCLTSNYGYSTVTVPNTFGCGTVAAAGTTQGTAAGAIYDHNNVTGANGSNGVILQSGCYRQVVSNNNSLNNLKVYPPSGDKIGASGMVDAAVTLLMGQTAMYTRRGDGVWFTVTMT